MPWESKPLYQYCEICNARYTTKPSHARRRKYCSRKCFSKAHSITMSGINNPAFKGKVKPKCIDCGCESSRPNSRCNPCRRKFARGSNHYNWQGGKTSIDAKARNSLRYKQWRRKVFERDRYTCQLCGKSKVKLHADHKKPFAIYVDERFKLSNGRTLCEECHKKTPTYLSGTRLLKRSMLHEKY